MVPLYFNFSGPLSKKLKIYFLLLFFGFFLPSPAQDKGGPKTSWSTEPFEQKVFIENKGQFNLKHQKVLFGTSRTGIDLYFTAKGITYKHDLLVPMTEEEIEHSVNAALKEEGEEEGKQMMKAVPEYFSVEWLGANTKPELVTEEPVSFYYTYSGEKNTGMKARAFKKIIYKELYPNIDVEYVLPEGKEGIKYSLIVHPGGDISAIKMLYLNAKQISISEEGNLGLQSTFGTFTDHAPSTFYSGTGKKINSAFSISKNTVSFTLGEYDHTQTIVIDPWTTNPTFPGFNSAYDVNYDAAGNVYVFGSYAPTQLVKLDNTGVIQWIFNAGNLGLNGGYYYYGDFAVDELSGTSYLFEGVNLSGTGARAFKVNSAGIQTGTFPGDPNFSEMWRAQYSRCLNQIVIAGGGIPPTNNQAAILDTNMVNIAPINILSTAEAYHDMVLLAIDNSSSFCFMASSQSQSIGNPANFNNQLMKCPIPALLPLAFAVPDGHHFGEVDGVSYVNGIQSNTGNGRPANGVNGMAVSPCWLYTYDSDTLKRWDKNSGALMAAIDISSTLPFYGGSNTNSIQVKWGGITTDEKDNIYLGVGTSVLEYNTSLALINTFVLPDTVYDVKLSPNNKLYACGKSFVTEISVVPNTTTVTTSSTPNTSCTSCNGTATSSIAACGTFTYLWNSTPPQTTQTATGLCPGTYTVTLTTNCSVSFTGTVTVNDSTNLTAIPGPNSTICIGQTATVTASGATTYTWSGGQTGTPATVTPTVSTSYSVIAATGTCSDTVFVTVNVNPLPIVTVNSGTICLGQQTATLTANGASTYSWNPSGSLSSGSGTSVTANPNTTTIYTVTGTDINSCVNTATASLLVNPLPNVTVNSSLICVGDSTTLTANGATSYSWNPGGSLNATSGTTVTAHPVTTTVYTITGTDANTCFNTTTSTVTVVSNPTIAVNNATICLGQQTATLTAGGATTYTWSPATGLSSTSGSVVTANPNTTTTYTINGSLGTCTAVTTATVSVNPAPFITVSSGTICAGQQTATLTANGASTYSWNPSGSLSSGSGTSVTANPNTTTIYTVTGTDINSCVNTATASVLVNPLPNVTVNSSLICVGDSTTLTANGAASYLWNPGGSLSSTSGTTVTANPGTTTIYTITGTDANMCFNTATSTVTVVSNPVINVNNATICLGQQTATLTANGATSYTWSPATGLSSTSGSTVTANPNTTTSYTINGSLGTCTAVTTATVSINPLPVVTVNAATICAGSTATLTANGANTYTWSTMNVGNTLVTAPALTTSYTVAGMDNNSCVNTATTTITVNPLPLVTVNSATICIGNQTILTVTGASAYTWTPAAGLSSTVGTPITANPAVTTAYIVTGTDANSCSNTDTALVVVDPLPNVSISNIAICSGSSGTLTAAGATTYTWSPSTGLSSSNGSPVLVNIHSTSVYTVSGADATGCINTATVLVTVNPLPLVSVSPPISSGCAPLCVTFTNTVASPGNCSWVFGDGTISPSCSPTHCFARQGTFNAVLTLTDGNNCSAADTAQVIVYPVPQADFNASPQPTTIFDPQIHFVDASNGATISSWSWNFGDAANTISTTQNPVFTYTAEGSYPVTLVVVSNQGCIDSTLKIIIIQPEWMIYVPNAFSPNFDGINDLFMAKGEGILEFKLYIFDRWGMQVFYSEDIYKGWDGRFQAKGNEIVQEDVYVWKIELRNLKGEPHQLKGTVSLLK